MTQADRTNIEKIKEPPRSSWYGTANVLLIEDPEFAFIVHYKSILVEETMPFAVEEVPVTCFVGCDMIYELVLKSC